MSTAATNKKVIAITGASSGIGKETAKQLVNNGFNVALLARSKDKLRSMVEELGNDNAFAVKADVSDFKDVDTAFEKVSKHFGRIDGIFANAGRGAKAAGIEKGDVDDWDGMLGKRKWTALYCKSWIAVPARYARPLHYYVFGRRSNSPERLCIWGK